MLSKKIILPILILALGIGGFMALRATRPEPPVAPVQEPVWRVQVQTVAQITASPLVRLSGRVESPELTQAAAPGVGRVARVAVREGQAVSPGQELIALDGRDFQPRVDQARAQVQELEAAIASEQMRHRADLDQLAQERRLLEFAAADLARFERLQREQFFSQAAVDQSRSALARQQISVRTRELAVADHQARLAQLEARRIQAQANLEQAQLALQRSRVVAPFAGYVAQVMVAAGDQVNNGQALIRLYPAAGLEVRAKLPAPLQDEFIAMLRQGRHATATVRVGSETVRLRLARVAGAADARGLDALFAVLGQNPPLRLGELVELHVTRAPVAGVVAIPYAALFDGNRVYRIVAGRLQAVAVEVIGEGAAEGGMARLLIRAAALEPDDRLLVTHLPNAVTGLKVEVRP